MVDDKELERLGRMKAPEPGAEARARAMHAAMQAFDGENNSTAPQGSAEGLRLTHQIRKLWRETMQKKLLAAPALAGLVALPIAGYATFYLMEESPFRFSIGQDAAEQPARQEADQATAELKKKDGDEQQRDVLSELAAPPTAPKREMNAAPAESEAVSREVSGLLSAPSDESRGRAA
ncbi:MAG: VWA domain-containing protein, partial [Alphaproteobacteria bacterium]|nr:VWA domain-containing protein [Alphaproteobacteria bacterium]